jgi:carboxypeptidase family protein/type IX secretion system substrate protein
MKSYLKLFIAVFFILVAVRTVKTDTYSVSGTVRYADNNEIVTLGMVKAYNVNTFELEAYGEIQPTGDYLLVFVRGGYIPTTDLIGLPGLEEETDTFVPTGYPDKTQSSQYVSITINQNYTGINIYVTRAINGGGNRFKSNISGIILDKNNLPLNNAYVYANNDNKTYGYAITNSKGEYTINNIPTGNYTISANRVSNQTSEQNVVLDMNGLTNINFSLDKIKPVQMNNNITPLKYNLSQNFPNPFNPSTKIKFSISASSMVTLNVFNSAGQEVASLVNGQQSAGSYEIFFDASTLSSGVYFYKLTAGSFTETRKMTLIK